MKNIPERSWFHSHLETRTSRIQGIGLFSKEFIAKGEKVMVWGGRLFNRHEIKSGKAKPNSVSGFGEGLYLGQEIGAPDTPDQFVNHSCDPNLWMTNEVTLTARRDIMPGEEITADYAMWEVDSDWKLDKPCNCGTSLCRGVITGRDWLLKEIQMRYHGHFLPFLNNRIIAAALTIDLTPI